MIRVRGVTVRRGERELLRDVFFAVGAGELVVLCGPNGAGKSTLLRVMSGEIEPTRGEVELDGRPLGDWTAIERAQRRAVHSQEAPPRLSFDALQIALFGRAPHVDGRESARDIAIARDALETAGVESLAKRVDATLSGGERQRVQLARAFAQVWEGWNGASRCLLLDEPTSSLDVAHQHFALESASRFARAGAAVVAVLHDLNLAAIWADRIVLLHDGSIVATGSPRDVLRAEVLEATFGAPVFVGRHPYLDAPFVLPRFHRDAHEQPVARPA